MRMSNYQSFMSDAHSEGQEAMDYTAPTWAPLLLTEDDAVAHAGAWLRDGEASNIPAEIDQDAQWVEEEWESLPGSIGSLSIDDNRQPVDHAPAQPCSHGAEVAEPEPENEDGSLVAEADGLQSLLFSSGQSTFSDPVFSSTGQSVRDGFNPRTLPGYQGTSASWFRRVLGDITQEPRSMYHGRTRRRLPRDSVTELSSHHYRQDILPDDTTCSNPHYLHGITSGTASLNQYDALDEQQEIAEVDAFPGQDEPNYYQESGQADSTQSQYGDTYEGGEIADEYIFPDLYDRLSYPQANLPVDIPSLGLVNPHHPQETTSGQGYPSPFDVSQRQDESMDRNVFVDQFGSLSPQLQDVQTNTSHWQQPGPCFPQQPPESGDVHGQHNGVYVEQEYPQTDGLYIGCDAPFPQEHHVHPGEPQIGHDRPAQEMGWSALEEPAPAAQPVNGQAVSGSVPSKSEVATKKKQSRPASSGRRQKGLRFPSRKEDRTWFCEFKGCAFPKKAFTSRQKLKDHQRTHKPTHERKWICGACSKFFEYPKDWRRHKKSREHTLNASDGTHFQKEFQCKECKKRFTRKDGLTRHQKKHCPMKRQQGNAQTSSSSERSTANTSTLSGAIPESSYSQNS